MSSIWTMLFISIFFTASLKEFLQYDSTNGNLIKKSEFPGCPDFNTNAVKINNDTYVIRTEKY